MFMDPMNAYQRENGRLSEDGCNDMVEEQKPYSNEKTTTSIGATFDMGRRGLMADGEYSSSKK